MPQLAPIRAATLGKAVASSVPLMNLILRVALPVPLHSLFDYRVDAEVAPGCRVLVPFGKRHVVGVAIGMASPEEVGTRALKPVERVLDATPLLTPELMATLQWAARYYQHPLGEVLQAALPVHLRSPRDLPETGVPVLRLTPEGIAALDDPGRRRGTRVDALLAKLAERPQSRAELDSLDGVASALRAATTRGWVERLRLPAIAPDAATDAGPALNEEQQAAADAVIASGGYASFLLDGVTGSGKTEVYLQIIRSCLARGRQALVLVPEIALTPQTLRRFRERLGIDIAALHSGLNETERALAWLGAARGEARVILGTRSALFVPLSQAGAILVDEEHDSSYKQQEGFRYHARDLAVLRAQALGVPVVLGSATPSLESLANATTGRYHHLRLRHRAGMAQPPTLQVVDLRHQQLDHGLARPTLQAIADCLERGEQALVFKNRRGYAPVLLCRDCGWSAQCPHCERAMTLHRRNNRLRCHHCGHERHAPNACAECGGLAIGPLGEGTERLEEALATRFPHVPVVRVDRDTTRGRRARDALFDRLADAGPRVLVGTQMLAKGHDLPHLTLVVVVGVDESLFSIDFRAGERLGQLVVQVAGRAGRAERPGTVILQTHAPGNPLLATLIDGGYRSLATRLLAERRDAGLPPFAHFALLRAEAKDAVVLDAFLRAALERIDDPGILAHGPLAAPMPLRAGLRRGQLLLETSSRADLQAFLPPWLDAVRALPGTRALRWSIDVDPVDLY